MKFKCSVCGKTHDLPAMTFAAPDYWSGLSPAQRAKGQITADDCIVDGQHFIRCTLPVAIKGETEPFTFGIWAWTTPANYQKFAAAFRDQDQSKVGALAAKLANNLPEEFQGALGLRCMLWPQDKRQRPIVQLEPTDHPLSNAQRDGLSFERIHRLLHDYGNI